MLLTERTVIPYLLERGLISGRSIVDGNLIVSDCSRRNRNFQVARQDGPEYVLKQGIDDEGAATIRNEATLYRFLTATHCHRERPFIPAFRDYDASTGVLVVDRVQAARTVLEAVAVADGVRESVARRVAKALARLHRRRVPGAVDPAMPRALPAPWVLSLNRPTPALVQAISTGAVEIITILQQFDAIGRHFDQMRAEWAPETLIHGDIKWDNILLSCRQASSVPTEVHIIDWELGGIGDPAWDTGSVFHDYLSWWVRSIPVVADLPVERLILLARQPLVRMQPAMRVFWQQYASQMRFGGRAQDSLLRATRFCAARLIQTAFEATQRAVRASPHSIYLMQLALNMLERPAEAAARMFGLPPANA